MTTTEELREQIARALHDQDQEIAAAAGVLTDGDNPAVWEWAREWADAVMVVVGPAMQAARAEAWDEGYEAAARYHELDTEHAAPNPYREGVP